MDIASSLCALIGAVTFLSLLSLSFVSFGALGLPFLFALRYLMNEQNRWRREVIATTLAVLETGERVAATDGAELAFSRGGIRVALKRVMNEIHLEVPDLAVGWELRAGSSRLWSSTDRMSSLGDAAFDQRFQLRGDPAPALVLLDAAARAELVQGMGEGHIASLRLAHGKLAIVLRAGRTGPVAIARGVQRALEIGALLRSPPALWETLLERLTTETEPSVGVEVFLVLLRAPEEGVRSRALALAAGSSAAPLRLACALHLGDLEAARREIDLGGLELPRLRLRLGELIPSSLPPETRRAIGLLLVAQPHGAAQTAGAHLLGRVCQAGDAEAEAALIALAEDRSPELQKQVSYALGVVGTLAAVPALLKMKEQMPWQSSGAEIVDAALRVVRSRLAGAEAGAIQLVEEQAEEGAIRISTQGGEVALVDEAPPRPRPVPQRQG